MSLVGTTGFSEKKRWAAQVTFRQAAAGCCASSTAVFCYDLMNEPLAPGGRRAPGEWYSGASLGGYDFLQFIALDPGKRRREEVAHQWIRAIRSRDRATLITVGLLPWPPDLGHLSGQIIRRRWRLRSGAALRRL